MRKTARNSKQGVNYKILGVVLVFLLVCLSVFLYFYSKIPECQRENYDMYYFFKAVKNDNTKLCDKIFMSTIKNDCNTMVSKKDASLCTDINCRAMITRNPNLCNEIKSEFGADESEHMKKVCIAFANLDENFFVSKEELEVC